MGLSVVRANLTRIIQNEHTVVTAVFTVRRFRALIKTKDRPDFVARRKFSNGTHKVSVPCLGKGVAVFTRHTA